MTATTPIARVTHVTARAATQAVQVVQQQGPGWLGGIAAGIQAALFSYALVLIPMWVFAATTTDSSTSWATSTGMAVRVWLLGFGVPWAVEGVPISLWPLGIPALTVLMLMQLARRFASATWTAGCATVVAFAGTVATLCAMAWSGAADHGDRVVRAAVIAAALAIPAVAWGLIRQRGAVLAWLDVIPAAVRAGMRLAAAMTGTLVVIAAVIAAGAVVAHRHVLAEAATALEPDTVSGIALAFLETLYAPTLVVWVMAWMSGGGYLLGGAHHVPSAAGDAGGPVPILASLPQGGGLVAWIPWLVVLIGFVMAFALRRRIGTGLQALGALAVGVALSAATIGVAASATTGSMGPGTFGNVGPAVGPTTVLVIAELGGGALAAAAVWHALGALYGTTTVRVRSTGAKSASAKPASAKPVPSGTPTESRSRSGQTRPADSPPGTESPAEE